MALPISWEHLIAGKTVEWERIEFKLGWNPLAVMHAMCAFANNNDVDNIEQQLGKSNGVTNGK